MFYRRLKSHNVFTRVFLLVVLLIAPCLWTSAQEAKPQSSKPATNSNLPQDGPCGDRAPSVLKIRLFIEQAKTFKDLEVSVKAVSDLSLLLWECDSQYAEAALLELQGKLKSKIEQQQDESRLPRQASAKTGEISLSKLKYLESYVLARISVHNKALAKRLANVNSLPWDEVNYAAVKSLLETGDYESASAELTKSINEGSVFGNIGLLVSLREKDPATADSLYMTYLAKLVYRSSLATEEVAEAGAYLFLGMPGDTGPPGFLQIAFVDRTPVPQFVSRNPAASDVALRAYLSLVAALLARPEQALSEKKARYALGRVLFRYIPATESGISNSFLSDLRRLSNEVTEGIKNERTYESITKAGEQNWDNLDQQIEAIEKIASTTQRDEMCIKVAYTLYSQRSYEKALKVVAIMSATDEKQKLSTVINLALALQQLEKKKFDEVQRYIENSRAGAPRSVVLLELSKALTDAGNSDDVSRTIMRAIDDARYTEGIERPLLLIKAGSMIKRSDPALAQQLLLEALDKINGVDKPFSATFETEVVFSRGVAKFRLPGVSTLNLGAVIEPFVKENPDDMATALSGLKTEKLRAEGFLAVAKYLIRNPSPRPAKQ